MIIWERGNLTGEIDAWYDGESGECRGMTLSIVCTGPRGGRTTLWEGDAEDAQQRINDLFGLLAGVSQVPERSARFA